MSMIYYLMYMIFYKLLIKKNTDLLIYKQTNSTQKEFIHALPNHLTDLLTTDPLTHWPKVPGAIGIYRIQGVHQD